MLTHAQKVELENKDGIVLLHGQHDDGTDFFAYMLMTLEQIEQIGQDSANGTNVDFKEYGTVVIAGKGTPSTDHIAYMEKEYSFQHPDI